MNSNRYLLFVLATLWMGVLSAQEQETFFLDNASATGIQQMLYKNSVVVGSGGVIYTAGATMNSSGNYDFLLTKHSALGSLLWSAQYAGSYGGDDYAADITLDASGNPIIVGTSEVDTLDYDAVVVKYNSSGVLQWVQTYAGAGNGPDGFTTVHTDGSNNVYVAGGYYASVGQLTNAMFIKYNSSGTAQWTNTWNNGTYNLQDAAYRIGISGSNASIIGATQTGTSPITWKAFRAYFVNSTGAFSSASTNYGDNTEFLTVKDVDVDASFNVYVAGTVTATGEGKNIRVARFDTNLEEDWVYDYNGADDLDDEALGLELSGSLLYVTGYTSAEDEGKNVFVAKLSQSTGSATWTQSWDEYSGDDEGNDLRVSSGGDLFIGGTSYKDGNLDLAVYKVETSGGTTVCKGRHNSDYNLNDITSRIALNPVNGAVYIAGQIENSPGNYEHIFTRWSPQTVYIPLPDNGFNQSMGYITNKGQLRNEIGKGNKSVKYYSQQGTPSTYIDSLKISFLWGTHNTDTTDTVQRVDMKFINGNVTDMVHPFDPKRCYANYYLAHMDKPAERVELVDQVIRKEVYDDTDVIYSLSPQGYRIWVVARAGAPTGDIEMQFDGHDSLTINGSGQLVIWTIFGAHIVEKAKAYTLNHTTGEMTLLGWQPSYSISGDDVDFTGFGSWSGTLVLEIEEEHIAGGMPPEANENLEWSTYIGSNGWDQAFNIAADGANNSWFVGMASPQPFPELEGVGTNVPNANSDAFIVKFNGVCVAQYATYYGGSEEDIAWGVDVNEQEEAFIVGSTKSEGLGTFREFGLNDEELNGIADGFFLKLDHLGALQTDSYIGGDGTDLAISVAYIWDTYLDQKSVYIVGHATDDTNFPVEEYSGGYNQSFAGDVDGFIMRISEPDGELQWSTFVGGDGEDYIHDVTTILGDPVFIGLTTTASYSTTIGAPPADGKFPNETGIGFQYNPATVVSNTYDNMFIMRMDGNNNTLDWSTFFGRGFHYPPAIQSDKHCITAKSNGFGPDNTGVIYVTGNVPTYSLNPRESSGNGYNKGFSGGESDAFIGKIEVSSSSATNPWTTYIGGYSDDAGLGLAIDESYRVYLTGWVWGNSVQDQIDWCTEPSSGAFPICDESSENYMETDPGDEYLVNGFIMAFNPQTEIIWSTLFGNGDEALGTALAVGSEKLFLAGNTYMQWTEWPYDDESEEDYWQEQNFGEFDATLARFSIPMIVGMTEFDEQKEDSSIHLFPNPSEGNISLQWGPEFEKPYIYVVDVSGKLVHTERDTANTGKRTMDISFLAPGYYCVKIVSERSTATGNFIRR